MQMNLVIMPADGVFDGLPASLLESYFRVASRRCHASNVLGVARLAMRSSVKNGSLNAGRRVKYSTVITRHDQIFTIGLTLI
jgi:hypothetical protein